MKTLGQILLILAVFVLVMGITYAVVNTNGSSTTVTTFERGADGTQPSLASRERPDFDDAGPRGGGWTLGMVKNISIIAIIVMLVVVPKRLMRKKVVPVQVR